jgi:hypothetical protein
LCLTGCSQAGQDKYEIWKKKYFQVIGGHCMWWFVLC